MFHATSRYNLTFINICETVFNSDNLFRHVLKAIVSQKTRAFFKDLVTKGNMSSYVQVTIYHCEKPICMRCTVTHKKQNYKNNSRTQFAREDVGLSPFYNSYVKKGKLFTTKFSQTI